MYKITSGQKFGNLLTIKETGRRWNSYPIWECLCDCGRTTSSSSYYLLRGKSKSCGINGHMLFLEGKKFGKLTVIKKTENKNKFSAWLCRCDCGNDFIAETRGLIHSRTKSCGCDRKNDLKGKKFGKLLVLKKAPIKPKYRATFWECLCDCGNKVYPDTTRLIKGKAISCGRCTRQDLTGKIFGNLTVISRSKKKRKSSNYYWVCNCICGKETEVVGSSLIQGTTKSCGCLRIIYKDRTLPAKKRIFYSYKSSALRKKLEFNLSYEDFLHLISQNCYYCGSPPSNKKEDGKITKIKYIYSGIDRKDNDKGYTKENCVSCCKICNYAKTDMVIDKFIDWLWLLGKNLRKKGYG